MKITQSARYARNVPPVPGRQTGHLAQAAQNSPPAQSLGALQRMADQSPVVQNAAAPQRLEEDELQGKFIRRAEAPKTNNTGLPDNLKAGIESLSGMSVDHVKVHRNSDKPAAVQAHAYAQGTDIHLAPGQDRHLPHEAWHVVQQAQGRVRPTMDLAGTPVNDDPGLEVEADRMGDAAQCMQTAAKHSDPTGQRQAVGQGLDGKSPHQRAAQSDQLQLCGSRENSGLEGEGPCSKPQSLSYGRLVTQRFKDDLLLIGELNGTDYPLSEGFDLVHIYATELKGLCNTFRTFENGDLEFAIHQRSAQAWNTYNNAVLQLGGIVGKVDQILPLIEAPKYAGLRAIVLQVRNCANADRVTYNARRTSTANEAQDAVDRAFKTPGSRYENPYAVYPNEYITPGAFNIANEAGVLQLHFSHWWSTVNYPGDNAEIHIFVGGTLWAIAHVKWNTPRPITGDPFMYNFKMPDGNEFAAPFSHIQDGSVQTYLLGEAMRNQ